MARNFLLLLCGLVLWQIIIPGCKSDVSLVHGDYPHILKLDTIRDQYNAIRDTQDRIAITTGNVTLTVKEDMLVIDHLPENTNEELITYFLQGATVNYHLTSDSLGKCEVLFLGRNLIVHPFRDKLPMLFTVRDQKVPAYLLTFKEHNQYIGFGLGARKFTKNGLHDNVPICMCEKLGTPSYDCNVGDDGGAHGCGTGTPDGSCEVSCSESAFACCDKRKQ